nr:zinc-binding dehydrogenase [Clostridiales bacterium]
YACRRGIINACHDNQTMGVQRDGSFQEYITMPVERIIPGKGLSAKELALIEPFSISAHALSRAEVKTGDRLLIMGAGPIGLFALICAKAMGAKVAIADLLESRLALAEKYGADLIINNKTDNFDEKCEAFTEGCGFDVCVEACGAPETFLSCIDKAAHGANIILIGNGKRETTFVHSIILKKELNIFGSRNAFTRDFETLIDLVSSGKVNILDMISGVYDADDAKDAFDALKNNDGSINKLLIRFSDAE